MKESYSYSDQEYTVGGNGTVVDAIYHKAKSPIDIGNRYIEALPYPLIDIQEIARHYEVGLHTNVRSERILSRVELRFFVYLIRFFFVYIGFDSCLEFV